jgi:type IV secretion system protein VirB8
MSDAQLKAFADASAFWEANEAVRARQSEKRAWRFAATGLVCGVSGCIAVALLTPLKTVEPFVVRVDKSNGNADIITHLDEHTVTYNEVMDRYFLARYVNYREEYSPTQAFANYEAVSLMSDADVGTAYFAIVNPKNPKSPSAIYKKEGRVDVEVSSIAFLPGSVAQVRFARMQKTPNSEPVISHWIASISYRYVKASFDAKARLVNPIGLQVTDYRLDSDNAGGAAAPVKTP